MSITSRSITFSLMMLLIAVSGVQLAAADRKVEDETPVTNTLLGRLNNQLASMGLNVRIAKASFLAAPGSPEVGQTIFADDRSKQLDTQWVPRDPRRGSRTTITYIVDQSDGAASPALSNAQTEAAIDRA